MGGDGGPCVLKDNPATGGGKKGKKGLLTYMESHRVPQPRRAYLAQAVGTDAGSWRAIECH